MKHTRKNKTKQPYRGSRAFDRTCRNHGGCSACESNRMRKHLRQDDTDIEMELAYSMPMLDAQEQMRRRGAILLSLIPPDEAKILRIALELAEDEEWTE